MLEPNIDAGESLAGEPPPQPLPDGPSYELLHERPCPTDYPRIVSDVAPVGGRIRVLAEDFEVEEVPLYPFSGKGEHCIVTVVKTNRTTLEAREYLARELGVPARDIGFAGFKDRRAVAQQSFSVAGIRGKDARRIQTPWLQVVGVTFHGNKLRTGHLQGNRFRITVRDIEPDSLQRARQIIGRLQETGLANFYGPQRFGHFGDSYRIGHALLHREPRMVVQQLLAPRDGVNDTFRDLFERQRYEEALQELPPGRTSEAAMLHSLRRHPGNFRAAVRKIPREMKRMYYSAYQSLLFNWCLRERLEWGGVVDLSQLRVGDLAFVHSHGRYFLVDSDNLDEVNERCANRIVSASGPIFGRKMSLPQGDEGDLERSVIMAEKLRPKSWISHVKGLHLDGSRRPYRIPLGEVTCEPGAEPDSLVLGFQLPPGGYATLLLEEVMGAGRTRTQYIGSGPARNS